MGTAEGRPFAPAILARAGSFGRVVVVSLFLSVVPTQPVGAATYEAQAFDQGVRAFRAGYYHAALESFLDARRAGLDTPGLRYNIGVTYYRLQRYPDAEQEFQALARDPEWAALAHYNLGLTAQRMGREQQAFEHYERAHRMTVDRNLLILAATAIERLGRAPLLPRTRTVLASLAAGHDSNVTLSSNGEAVGISDRSDFFVDALATANQPLNGTPTRGTHAHGALFLRKYTSLDQFDVLGMRLGLSRDADSGRWQSAVGGYLDLIYVDGDRLQHAATLDIQASRRLDAGRDVRGRYQLGRINGGGGFEYLDGWQHRFSVDGGFALAPAALRVGYQLEYDDRKDLQQGSDFLSYSPTRHSLFAGVSWPGVGGWRTDARGEYRTSRYNDPHRLDGGTREVTREDDRYGIDLRASRRLTALRRVFIDYSYYRNNSNLGAYDYNRHQVLVGVEAVF